MDLVPFSKKHPDEFLSRDEGNIDILLKKLKLFLKKTRSDLGKGKSPRRKLKSRFNYEEELKDLKINQAGISSEEVAEEFNDILQGGLRHQDPLAAFNMIPAPLFDVVAGITLMSLYNQNPLWDFISGKLCLYEKKIIRMLGQLVHWPKAEGYVVTGGKQALIYAIRNGIARATLNSPCEIGDLVVICSKLAHYSIEHACHYLGIAPENCLRVETDPSGEMNPKALEKVIARAVLEGKRIAIVIAVAGGTINLVPDSILDIKETIKKSVKTHKLDYMPFLHVDSVISWTWLAFKGKSTNKIHTNPRIAEKINHILSKLQGLEHADSFAADFHKTAFCPYAAGVYIAKDSSCLTGMAVDRSVPKGNISFGEFETFRHTLENSRSGLGIVAIWIALRRMGLQGLREFVLYQLEVCEKFKQVIQNSYAEHFEVINEHSNGWEIVIKPLFFNKLSWEELQKTSSEVQQEYIKICHQFLSRIWHGSFEDSEENSSSVIGFVKKYSRKGAYEQSFPAFLIHPTSLHYDEKTVHELLQSILQAKVAFENNLLNSQHIVVEEHLARLVPPR